MKMLYRAASVIGYRIVHLVEDEEYGIPLIVETGARPDGEDFAVFWNGAWREGRCYTSFGNTLTFVTYGDAERIPLNLDKGMIKIRVPIYVLTTDSASSISVGAQR